jgi:adenine-specific DNA methylase
VTAIEAMILRRKAIHLDINPLANFITEQIAVSPVDLAELTRAFEIVEERCAPVLKEWSKKPDRFFDQEPPFWYPKEARLPSNADADSVKDLFTRRQLFSLALILDAIGKEKNEQLRNLLRFCFSGALAKANRTFISAKNRAESRGGPTIFSVYRYNIPKNPVELDAWEQFQTRFRNLIVCKKETNRLIGDFYSPANIRVLQGSATALSDYCSAASVDYVFTDPPYGAYIAYLDLSTMWNAWLGFRVTGADQEEEVIEGGDRQHSREHYVKLLSETISQVYRVLKPGAWFSLVFQHRDSSLYSAIVEATEQAGLRHANTVSQALDFVWSMHKKKNKMNVLSGELILNFRKMAGRVSRPAPRRPMDLREVIQEVAEREIRLHRGASTESIFNHLMVRLMDLKQISQHRITLEDVLRHLASAGFTFDSESGRWYVHQRPSRDQLALTFSP